MSPSARRVIELSSLEDLFDAFHAPEKLSKNPRYDLLLRKWPRGRP
jgi:hypothetical protein